MSADREFTVKVNTLGDASGVRVVDDSLKGLNATSGAGSAATMDLSEKTKQFIDKLNEQRIEQGKVEISHHEIREVVHHLSREMPELGLIGRFALNPWIASLGLVLWEFGQLAEMHKKTKEMLAERIDPTGIRDIIEAIGPDGLSKALSEAKVESQGLIDELDRIANSQASVKEKTDAAIDAIKKQAELLKGEHSAEEELNIARIKAQVAAGKISPEEGEAQEESTRNTYRKVRTSAADRQEQDIIEAKELERLKLQEKINAGRGDAPIRENQAKEAESAVDTLTKTVDAWKKQADDQSAYIKKFAGTEGFDSGREDAKYKLFLQGFFQAQGKLDDAKVGQNQTTKALDEFTKSLTEAQTELTRLNEEIPRLRGEHADASASRAHTDSVAGQTDLLNLFSSLAGGKEGKDVEHAAAVLAMGNKAGAQDQAFYKNFLAQLTSQSANQQQAQQQVINLLRLLANSHVSMQQQVDALRKLIEQNRKNGSNSSGSNAPP